ncbi:triosephosphate isomerase [Coprinopsis sp. MPI-PUGE-AT-0042]|nr:triosephosphate isomerase [Coprinopsis sp. MPI-PUGE-AT-0042]
MARTFFVGGNWKLNPTSLSAAKGLVENLNKASLDSNTEVVIAPPTLYLLPIQEIAGKHIKVAAQNAYWKESGAFTGELSSSQLVDAGIPYVVLGHSERRTIFHETSEQVAIKTKAALEKGLKVILCIGETLKEREEGRTAAVCEEQLSAVVKQVKPEDWSNIVIAYEPVWAIGTGKVATTSQAQEAHVDIRKYLAGAVSADVALARLTLTAFLVGGASLKPEFADIINSRKA